MANLIIPPRDLPAANEVFADSNLVVDTGAGVFKATPQQVLDAATMLAVNVEMPDGSSVEQAAGTALTTAQRVEATNVPEYQSRAALGAAIPGLAAGSLARVGDVTYRVDPNATGMNSALWPEGINGVRSETPENMFFGTFFKTDDALTDFYTTQDPKSLLQVNSTTISRGKDQALFGFDPSLWWDKDRKRFSQHVFQGGGPGDVTEYRTRDLITFEVHYRNFGATRVRSDTVPYTGGTVPASVVWWMGLHEEVSGPNAGQLYGVCIIRLYDDFVDVNGRTIPNLQLHTARVNNRDNMTFDAPVRMGFPDQVCRIGFFPVWDGTRWVAFMKNDFNKNIECWHAPTLTGTWTFQYTLDYAQDAEGCCVVPEYYYAASSNQIQRRWHLLTDAYSTGNYFQRSSDDLVTWSAEQRISTTTNIRHGNLYNFAYQPEAVKVIERALSYYGAGTGRPDKWVKLAAGVNDINPREDVIYYVENSDIATVNITRPGSRRPRFVVQSDSPTANIVINNGAYFTARNGVSEIIGANSARAVFELTYDGARYSVPNQDRDAVGVWVAFGDSNTQRLASWANKLAPRKAKRFHNFAVGGATMVGNSSGNTMVAQIVAAAGPVFQSANLVTLMFGTNDATNSLPIGTVNDTTTATFYGAMRAAMVQVNSACPSARLVFMTPIYRDGFEAQTEPYRAAIRNFCDQFNVTCIDAHKLSGFNSVTYSTLYADAAHPNDLGYTRLANSLKPYF